MKNIAIFQKDLGIGGIQRSLLNLLTFIDLSDYNVDLFLFEEPRVCKKSDLKNVNLYILKPLFYLNRIVDFNTLKKFINYNLPNKEYDVAIDYNSYSNECALCALTVPAKKRIMWIHNDVEIEYKNSYKYRILWSRFKKKFTYYDEFVAVSEGIVEPFKRFTNINNKKITVIPNVINVNSIIEKSRESVDFKVDKDKINFIFAGRFTRQKGVDMLLDYFSEALLRRRDIHLYLLGDGSEKQKIINQIRRKKIEKYVTIIPAKNNPYPYIAQMDALILTSRHEGQGMVLLEAKALGLDIIFPKRLEIYNEGLEGSDDIVSSIVNEKKHIKSYDTLDDYNLKIKNSLHRLLNN